MSVMSVMRVMRNNIEHVQHNGTACGAHTQWTRESRRMYSITRSHETGMLETRMNHKTLRSRAMLQPHFRSVHYFWQVLSKEAIEKRQKALQEELQRGYFDDMKDLRDTDGRLGPPPDTIAPPSSSVEFPSMDKCVDVHGHSVEIPPRGTDGASGVTFLSVAFRSGAQEHLNSWSEQVALTFAQSPTDVQMMELGLIDSWVMGLFPFKQTILSNAARLEEAERLKLKKSDDGGCDQSDPMRLQMRQIFRFGDAESFRKSLYLHNKLAAFVFLLDSSGRIRWRMSGPARQGEDEILVKCIHELVAESKSQSKLTIQ